MNNVPARNVFRIGTPETFLVVHGLIFALSLLGYNAVFANVKFSAVFGMREGWMREYATERASDVSFGTREAIVQYVFFHVVARPGRIGRPNAACHFIFVNETRWTRGYRGYTVDAINETIAGGWIVVFEYSIGTGTSFGRLCFFWKG